MRNLDAAYIAGFFDGEGWVHLYRRRKPGCTFRIRVGFTNRNLQLLRWIKSHFYGTIHPKKRRSTKHSQSYDLTIHRNLSVRNFLKQIGPFVKLKKRHIAILREFLSLPHINKRTVRFVKSGSRSGLSPVMKGLPCDIRVRECIRLRLLRLNLRGPH